MVEQGRSGGGTQHGCFYTLLVRPDNVRRETFCANGDADAALLGVAAVPVLEGSWGQLCRMGEKYSGLVCGAPGTPCGQRLAQGMNNSHACERAVAYPN